MEQILLPTDFSENLQNAIEYAMALFKNWECQFHILNVQKLSEYMMDDVMASTPGESAYNSIVKDNKVQLKELIKQLSKKYKSQSFTFNALFDFDDFVPAVNQAVKSHNIDLIIMGTNGATGASEVVFGSNTLKVLRNVDCPILAIPEGFKFKSLKNILFTYNQSKPADLSSTSKSIMTEILGTHQPTFEVLGITDYKAEQSDQTALTLIDYPSKHHSIKASFDWYTLQIAAQLLQADLKVIQWKKESLVQRILLGSENTEWVYNSMVPMLFLR